MLRRLSLAGRWQVLMKHRQHTIQSEILTTQQLVISRKPVLINGNTRGFFCLKPEISILSADIGTTVLV